MPPTRTAECNLPVADCNRSGSPNPDAFLRCDEHFVGRLDFKGVVPDVRVSSGTNHAKLAWGMRVAYDLLFDVIVGDFSAPRSRHPDWHERIRQACEVKLAIAEAAASEIEKTLTAELAGESFSEFEV